MELAWENKRLLLGESLPHEEKQRLRDLVGNVDGVRSVPDFRTVHFGPESVVVTENVALERNLDVSGVEASISSIESQLRKANEKVTETYIEPRDGCS